MKYMVRRYLFSFKRIKQLCRPNITGPWCEHRPVGTKCEEKSCPIVKRTRHIDFITSPEIVR